MAFLQARMGSSRLPGKVLMDIEGRSVLGRAICRLRASEAIDEVAVLTTELGRDDAVAREAERFGVPVFRGSEDDVLARFHGAAERFGPDIVIRATADNPLIDIGSLDRIVTRLMTDRLDYCVEIELPYGAATEALTAQALRRTHERANEPRHREHVTMYIREHPEEFSFAFPPAPDALRHPEIRVTVDTEEDLTFMRRLIASMPEGATPIPLQEYLPLAARIERGGGRE